MGGSSSSPRRVTITDEDGSGTVQISEAVARRLLGKPELEDHPETPAETGQPIQSTITAEERDDELEKLENHYKKRIDALDKKNRELYQTTTEQFAKAVQDIESKFMKTTASPVCSDLQLRVLECYKNNPHTTLHCSEEVRSFNACVQSQKKTIMSAVEAN